MIVDEVGARPASKGQYDFPYVLNASVDNVVCHGVGEVSYAARRLVRATYEAMWKGIAEVKPGARLGDIGHAISRHAKAHGYTVVKEYCGHGIGKEMHEDPQILHYGRRGTGMVIEEGMVFTIEPMINQGRAAITAEPGEWPVYTRDGSLSAQFEHTVAVTRNGVRVLTLRPGEVALCSLDA
jgi:methionyl aminopeptidase